VGEYRDYVPTRVSRGVVLARLGRRDDAHKDAKEALKRDATAPVHYQVAGIYALTSRTHPQDRDEALRLLESALQRGFVPREMDRDPDLDPIRDHPRFRALVRAARELRPAETSKATAPHLP
jgi:hypothetical protein